MSIKNYVPSVDKKNIIFFDDFIGSSVDTFTWSGSGTGSMALQNLQGGQIRLSVTARRTYSLSHGSIRQWRPSSFEFTWRARLSITSDFYLEFGANNGSTPDYIAFWGSDGNWYAITQNSLGRYTSPIITAMDTNWHTFRAVSSSDSVVFFMDNVHVATSTTFLPTNNLQPWLSGSTSSTNHYIYADWVEFIGS
jgi:hypothetical protein